MAAPPEIFNPGRTHCPSCNGTLATLTDHCPLCGFTASICVQRYPFEPPPLTALVDPHGTIGARDRRRLAKAVRRFEKQFPQIWISTCVTRLPEGVDGREFGFWLFNRSQPQSDVERARRPYMLLLVVDTESDTLSVTAGYGIDCFLDDVMLSKTLVDAEGAFIHDGVVAGITRWLRLLAHRLAESHEDALYAHNRWQRRVVPSTQHTDQPAIDPAPTAAPRVSEGYREVADPEPAIANGAQQPELKPTISNRRFG